MAQFKIPGSFQMNDRPRMKLMAACIGVALAQWGAGPALADSGVGVDTALGNALNPPGRSAVPRPVAPEGYDTVRHSPSGQLYGVPYDASDEGSNKTDGGWQYSGGIEAGVLGGDAGKQSVLYRKYKDLKNGPYLDYFEVEADQPGNANYIQAFGGGVGQDDQFYGFQFGRYNDWKVKLFYNETVHVFSDNWKSFFGGEGSGNLTTVLLKPKADGPATATPIATRATALGLTAVGTAACSAIAPCWAYDGKLYAGNIALLAINGTTGTADATGAIVVVGTPTATRTGATQSNLAAAIKTQLAATAESELSLVRKKGGVRADATLTNFWKGYVSYTQEERKGARPFAMNEVNASFEIPEPIDYTTHELLAGLQYADSLTQANLRASLSLFRNNIDVLNVQFPLLSSALAIGAIQTATYDLYPDNDAVNLKGEFARNLPDFYKGRFTASVSWGTNRQDDNLLPPISAAQNAQLAGITTFAGTTPNIGYANGTAWVANWNSIAALSQTTAKQRIDNTLVDLALSLKPTDALSLKGSLRYYDTENKGGYMAYNPQTGQFGRGVVDANGTMDVIVGLQPGTTPGNAGSCYVPPGYPAVSGCKFGLVQANGANVAVFGQARSTQQLNYVLSGDYDLTRTSSINAAVEREEFKRNFRERDKTWEDKLKLGYVNRALGDTTLRTSIETGRKRGSDYRYRTFEDMGTGLPGLTPQQQLAALGTTPVTPGYAALNANLFSRYSYYFRKYDQADRDQNILNARLNYLAREDLDLGATFQWKDVKYPNSFYGLEKDNLNSLTLDFNYQPSWSGNFYGFYSVQQGKKAMNLNSGIASAPNTACTLANLAIYGYAACSDGISATNGARPLTSAWTSNTDDRNDVFGFGMQSDIGRTKFGLDYTYSYSSTNIAYSYMNTGGTAFNNVVANQNAISLIAGNALPSVTYVQQTLNLNLIIPIDKKLAIRLFDRFEFGKVKDWHYDNVITGAVAAYDSGTLLLDAGPQNYHVNVIGLLFQYKL
jgi:hypothetical protein